MKKFLIAATTLSLYAGSAQAADLPARTYTKAPPISVYEWSGFYVGAHIGGAFLDGSSTLQSAPAPLFFPLGTRQTGSGSAFLGGGQIGFNYRLNPNWLIGIEGDASGTDLNISVFAPSTLIPGSSVTSTTHVDWYATLTGRLGYTSNNWLLYAKGGVAWAGVSYGGSSIGPVAVVNGVSDTRTGWTVGVGIENGFAPNWSWKVEYNYVDFGNKDYGFTTTPAFGTTINKVDMTTHLVKAGVNYHFNWGGPVVAKY